MANAKTELRDLTGLNSLAPSKGAVLAQGGDNVPAMVHSASGTPEAPAAIKEGEIIFSVPAVIGAGNGDYDKGAKILLALHKRFKAHGEMLLKQQGLGSSDIGKGPSP